MPMFRNRSGGKKMSNKSRATRGNARSGGNYETVARGGKRRMMGKDSRQGAAPLRGSKTKRN